MVLSGELQDIRRQKRKRFPGGGAEMPCRLVLF